MATRPVKPSPKAIQTKPLVVPLVIFVTVAGEEKMPAANWLPSTDMSVTLPPVVSVPMLVAMLPNIMVRLATFLIAASVPTLAVTWRRLKELLAISSTVAKMAMRPVKLPPQAFQIQTKKMVEMVVPLVTFVTVAREERMPAAKWHRRECHLMVAKLDMCPSAALEQMHVLTLLSSVAT